MNKHWLTVIAGSLLAYGVSQPGQAQQRVLVESYDPTHVAFDHAAKRCPPGFRKISGIMPTCYEPCDATQGWRTQLKGNQVRCIRCPQGWNWPVSDEWCVRPNTGGSTLFGQGFP